MEKCLWDVETVNQLQSHKNELVFGLTKNAFPQKIEFPSKKFNFLKKCLRE